MRHLSMADFNRVRAGDIFCVVNLSGCPKANTVGHARLEHLNGTFGGLVCTKSLKYKGSK